MTNRNAYLVHAEGDEHGEYDDHGWYCSVRCASTSPYWDTGTARFLSTPVEGLACENEGCEVDDLG
jgi:hypothetical protein